MPLGHELKPSRRCRLPLAKHDCAAAGLGCARQLVALLALAVTSAAHAADSPRRAGRTSSSCAGTASENHTVVDLDSLVVQPLEGDRIVAERTRGGIPRAATDLVSALQNKRGLLSDCYAWARSAGPSLVGILDATLEIDPWGIVSDVSFATFVPGMQIMPAEDPRRALVRGATFESAGSQCQSRSGSDGAGEIDLLPAVSMTRLPIRGHTFPVGARA
jgi:hypothetical protein